MNKSEQQMAQLKDSNANTKRYEADIKTFFMDALITQNKENVYTLHGNHYLKNKELTALEGLYADWKRKAEEVKGEHGEEWKQSTTAELEEQMKKLYNDSKNHLVTAQKLITEEIVSMGKVIDAITEVAVVGTGATTRKRAFIQFFNDRISTKNKQLAQLRKDLDFVSKQQSDKEFTAVTFAENTALEYQKQFTRTHTEYWELNTILKNEQDTLQELLPEQYLEYVNAVPELEKELEARLEEQRNPTVTDVESQNN